MNDLISILNYDFIQHDAAKDSFDRPQCSNQSRRPCRSAKRSYIQHKRLLRIIELQETRLLAEALHNYINYCIEDLDPETQQEIQEQTVIALVCAAPNNPEALGAFSMLEKHNREIPSFKLASAHFENKGDSVRTIYYDAMEELEAESDYPEVDCDMSEFGAEVEQVNPFDEKSNCASSCDPTYDAEEFILAYIHYLGQINRVDCLAWQRSLPTLMNEHVQVLFDIANYLTDRELFHEGFKQFVKDSVKFI